MSLKEIQNNMEYQKVVLDQRLRYYEPNGEHVYKTFADEISNSLRSNQKSINPKFFYDEKGSHLFEKICTLPEYYLTNAEISILNQLDDKISPHLDGDFRLVELGSGSSTKTRILIQILERLQTYVEYIPIDISRILKTSSRILQSDFKRLYITGIIDEYESGLKFLKYYDTKKNLIIFLGSSFGNFDLEDGSKFLSKINSAMKKDDLFLIGLDLVKDKKILECAYNDSEGITAQFNLNILSRINSELGGNFDLQKFRHHAVYNEDQNKIEMYLRSIDRQIINIPQADLTLNLEKDELIHTENSQKFTISNIKQMSEKAGFEIKDMWYDEKQYFAMILLSKND
tara:strand:+ start:24 stop:1052 length:1029 start_codon:yes stop_codon:yes gene_type:complete